MKDMLRFLVATPWLFAGDVCLAVGYAVAGVKRVTS